LREKIKPNEKNEKLQKQLEKQKKQLEKQNEQINSKIKRWLF
jgi:hypothetical protein